MRKFRTRIEFYDGDDLYPAGNIYDSKDFPKWKIETWKESGFIEFVIVKPDGTIEVAV